MKENLVPVEEILDARIQQLMDNPQRFQEFVEYNAIAQKIFQEKFGVAPDWENIPIEEKCYHGWLRPYAFLSETIINGRWAYWHGIRATQEVKGKPIPQLHFYKSYDKEYQVVADMLKTCLKGPKPGYYDNYRTFTDFVDWLLYSWGSPLVKKLNSSINAEIQEYWYKHFNADLMFLFPSDYFVGIASDLYSGKGFNANMFYPTPANVVEVMVQMVYGNMDPEEAKYMLVNEPCCGSGTMLLYQSNYSLRLTGQDISLLMAKITTLNGYFYVPWMVETDDKTNELLEKEYQNMKEKKGA